MRLKKKPNPDNPKEALYYARLNKNFVVNGDLAKVAKEQRLNGRDLYVLIALLAEAQHKDSRSLQFSSTYSILKLLGWSDRGGDYDALESALAKWMGVEISIKKSYVPAKAVGQEFDHLVKQRVQGQPRGLYEAKTFKRILNVVGKDDGVRVKFDKEFWRANPKEEGYFVRAWPSIIKQLKYPPEIFLWLLLSAFNHSLQHNLERLRLKMALGQRSRPWLKKRIQQALEHINETRDSDYKMRINANNVVSIGKAGFVDKLRNRLILGDDLDMFLSRLEK
jgi:hypothetical protein